MLNLLRSILIIAIAAPGMQANATPTTGSQTIAVEYGVRIEKVPGSTLEEYNLYLIANNSEELLKSHVTGHDLRQLGNSIGLDWVHEENADNMGMGVGAAAAIITAAVAVKMGWFKPNFLFRILVPAESKALKSEAADLTSDYAGSTSVVGVFAEILAGLFITAPIAGAESAMRIVAITGPAYFAGNYFGRYLTAESENSVSLEQLQSETSIIVQFGSERYLKRFISELNEVM